MFWLMSWLLPLAMCWLLAWFLFKKPEDDILILEPRDEQVLRGSFNPKAANVTFGTVNVGCNMYGSDTQSSNNENRDSATDDNNMTQLSNCKREEAALRDRLKKFYQKITLPSLPWIEAQDISIKCFTKLQLETGNDKSENKIIQLHNLFDAVNGKNPKQILIESQPGYGKTTLAHKIVSDWVNEVDYVRRFKYAVLIFLRHFKSNTLKDEIIQKINNKNHAEESEIWRIFNIEDTLVILDGLDEATENVRRNIGEILNDAADEYKMTIVITCRVGLSQLKRREANIPVGLSMKREFWCKKITILGIDTDNRKKFLNNFIDHGNKDKLMSRLLDIIQSRENMFKSPLMLILLVYVTREDNDIKIKTTTDLYKQFTDYIIRRSIAKTNPEEANFSFTVFDSSINVYSSLLYKFGKMCLDHILHDNLQFNANADTEAIHQLGFLLKHETKKKMDVIAHYEGFHLSILEFAASVFLHKEFRDNQNRFCDSLLNQIVEIGVKKESSSQVIPFLCALLGNDAASFFNQLPHYHVNYWITEKLLESTLSECEMNESTSDYFMQIVPRYFHLSDSSPILAIANQCTQNYFFTLKIDLFRLKEITNPMYVCVLNCDISDTTGSFTSTEILQVAKNVTCDTLILNVLDGLSYDILNVAMKVFVKLSSKNKTLRVSNLRGDNFLHLANCVLPNTQFDLITRVADIDKELDAIVKIIEYNQVANLTIALYYPELLSAIDILELVGKTKCLKSLGISTNQAREKLTLYLDAIIVNSGKELDLFLDDIQIECEAQQNCNRYIKSLSINTSDQHAALDNEVKVISSVMPTCLHCKWKALHVLNNDTTASSWIGWDSVVELTLTFSELTGYIDFKKFKKLRILVLESLHHSPSAQDVEYIIASIECLKLQQLEIRWINESRYGDIISEVQKLIKRNRTTRAEDIRTIRFVNVWIEEFHNAENKLDFKYIQSILELGLNISFCFLFYDWEDLQKFFKKYVFDLLRFKVSYEYVVNTMKNIASKKNLKLDLDPNKDLHKLKLTLQPFMLEKEKESNGSLTSPKQLGHRATNKNTNGAKTTPDKNQQCLIM